MFADRPPEKIWQWADENVFFDSTMAERPGPYRSTRTPWARRIQELAQNPVENGRRIRKIVVMKSSQSGFTEAILNCIRWFSKFSPRNIIYAINSQEESGNISDRLTPTLKSLGENIFTGDDDDEKRFALKLRHMKIWFFGSHSAGKFANKQAPFKVCDEYEEHGRLAGDTTSLANLESRGKKSIDDLTIVISKPKMYNGPIHAEFLQGNREIFMVPCPHCGTSQEITFEALKFDHCKNLLGEWDKTRVLTETFLKCAGTNCDQPISQTHLPAMVAAGRWMATAKGDPGVISQHISDLYDAERPHIWGEIALKMINSKGDPVKRMGVYNHDLGKPWRPHAIQADRKTILDLREPYKRGSIPFPAWFKVDPDDENEIATVPLILGGDTQLDFSPWAVNAIGPDGTIALIDWGRDLHPASLVKIALEYSWPEAANPETRHIIVLAGIDSPYRKEDVYEACLHSRMICWPVAGAGGIRSRSDFAIGKIPTYSNPGFGLITFNDFDFSAELLNERIPARRFIVPIDIEQKRAGESFDIIAEIISTRLAQNKYGDYEFTNAAPGQVRGRPNHFFDCVKIACLMWRYMNRKRDPDAEEPAEPAAA